MTTDGSESSAVIPVPVVESRQPDIATEQAILLDIAGMMSLTRTDAETVVVDAIARMLAAHGEEIDANGVWRRARLTGERDGVDAEIILRSELSQQLTDLRTKRSELRKRCIDADSQIARAQGDLTRRRNKAEDDQLENQIATLRAEEAGAQRRAANMSSEESGSSEEKAAKRQAAIDLLEQKHGQVLDAARPAVERAEALAARSITQTVAGFLLWLGYGSVAATGAVLALMMNGGDSGQFGIVIEAWRAVVESMGLESIWLRVVAGVGLVAFLLLSIGASIAAAERWLLKKRDDWNKDEQKNREPHVNLSPQSITRKTYTQFIALLPFLFGAGMIATVLSVTPAPAVSPNAGDSAPGGVSVVASVLPTLGYAFVGIVIAFLATAVFVMYVVRIVEPREKGGSARPSVLRTAWEFVIPPVALIIAVAGTPFLLNSATSPGRSVVAGEWVPWAMFMLLSSLALACGVVYHGVFKDAKTARERIEAIETRLDLERGLTSGGVRHRDETITRDYDEQLRRLEGVRRDLRLARLGVSITGRKDDSSVLVRAWRWIRRRGRGVTATGSPVGVRDAADHYRPIEFEVASDVITELARLRSDRAFILEDLETVDAAIRRCEQLTAFEVMLALKRRLNILKGDLEASKAEDAERKSRAKINGEVLTLGVRSVIANGSSVKPFFEGVRADLARRVPHVAIPAPRQGDDHE